jgi:hypothetical protein
MIVKSELRGYDLAARIVGNGSVPRLRPTPEYRKLAAEIGPGNIIVRTNFYSEEI